MKANSPIEIDGRNLYYMFLAGANKIIENQSNLNKINVFPVPDGDTGTNMASTVRSVIDTLEPERSYKNMADSIAESTLLNARGNSGIIFAQFLYGMSCETGEFHTVTLNHFIESIKSSVKYVYKAVSNPVEGTMLTIIRTWAEFIDANKAKFSDFNQLFLKSKNILEASLEETKTKLEVLRKADVVDAGANAFFIFIQGMIELIKSKNIRNLIGHNQSSINFEELEEQIPQDVKFRYCTEGILKNISLEQEALSEIIQQYGDSVVVAGAKKTSRIHVHTDNPSLLFKELEKYGTITFQKADDMVRQSEAVYKRKAKIALVTDSACDLPAELFDEHQIHLLPLNINFGDNHYLDKVTIKSEQFYERLKNDKDFPKTSQINEISFRNLYSHLASHYDAIIAVHLTEKFSGTFHSSVKAAEKVSNEFGKKIAVIDSKNISGAIGLIVLRIAEAIERGEEFDKVVEKAKDWVSDTKIFVSVKTLKYMVKGGRVSPLKGMLAKLMNVKPIVSMDPDGKSEIFGKTYNQKTNMEKVIKHIKEISQSKKIWNYILLHANNIEGAAWFEREMEILSSKKPIATVNISPVVAASAGIGAASVAFMYE